ncbi:UNVERIFIED_CONTAM: hypothetical protein GTU68_036930 [Idotea baltica]|nr:hypothetical protein [Idotea baltica]
MVNPAKVRAFLDVFGNWDPSLAFVMGAALLVTAIGYRLVWLRERPVFSDRFQVPGNRKIDMRLAIGAVLFGAGWGLIGLCPGPALAAITFGGAPAFIFLATMVVGILAFDMSPLSGRERDQQPQKRTLEQ